MSYSFAMHFSQTGILYASVFDSRASQLFNCSPQTLQYLSSHLTFIFSPYKGADAHLPRKPVSFLLFSGRHLNYNTNAVYQFLPHLHGAFSHRITNLFQFQVHGILNPVQAFFAVAHVHQHIEMHKQIFL